MSKGKFQIFQSDKNDEYYFRLLNPDGVFILGSEGYKSKSSCLNGIASVKANAPYDSRYERKDNGTQYWFNLEAANGEIIGKSKMYGTATARDAGIEEVKKYAPDADTEDLT